MSSGRAAKTKKDDGFTTRTVMAMVHEMATMRKATERANKLFEALATTHGIKIDWDDQATH